MNTSLFPESGILPAMPPVAILAGGLPKSMVPVAGEPFLAHQLRLLSRQGFRQIVLCVGHLGEQIEAFVGDGAGFGCGVGYSYDGVRPLGTGGAIRQALPLLGEHFAVLYGDSYLPAPLLPAFRAFATSGKAALMTIFHNHGRFDRSNIEFRAGQIVRYEKRQTALHTGHGMEHIDYGFSFYSAAAFLQCSPSPPFDLSEVQQTLIARQAMAAWEVTERFYEIGSPQGLRETEDYLRSQSPAQDRRSHRGRAEYVLPGVPV
jgi:NDP-sugar pyrophosphorylase family protein